MGADESKPAETGPPSTHNNDLPPGSAPSTLSPAESPTTATGEKIVYPRIPLFGVDNPATTSSNTVFNSAGTPPTPTARSGVSHNVSQSPSKIQTSASGANRSLPNAARVSTPPVSVERNVYPSLQNIETGSRSRELATLDTGNFQTSHASNMQTNVPEIRSVEDDIRNFEDVPEIETSFIQNRQAQINQIIQGQLLSAPSTSSMAKTRQQHWKNTGNKGICKQKGITKNAQANQLFATTESTRSTISEIDDSFDSITPRDTNKADKVNRVERTPVYRNQAQQNGLSRDTISCPICMEPMLGAIYQCFSGHSLCDRCRENLTEPICPSCRKDMTQAVRNRALEDVIKMMKIACPNREKGCIFSLSAGNMRDHLDECIYRTMTCPVGAVLGLCSWKGDMKDMTDHFQNTHPNRCGLEPAAEITVKNVSVDDRSVNLIVIGKYLFLLHVKVDTQQKRTYWLIQNIGTKNAAKSWTYELHFYNKSEPKRKLFYADCCSSDTESADALFRNARCAVVPSDVLAPFFNAGKFNYKFYVRKTDRKPDLGKPERNRNQDYASSEADPRENPRKGRKNYKKQ